MLEKGKSYVTLNCLLKNDRAYLVLKLKAGDVPYIKRKVNARTPNILFETKALKSFIENYKTNTTFSREVIGWNDKLSLVLNAIDEERKKDGLEAI